MVLNTERVFCTLITDHTIPYYLDALLVELNTEASVNIQVNGQTHLSCGDIVRFDMPIQGVEIMRAKIQTNTIRVGF